jgi:hypothetical protein
MTATRPVPPLLVSSAQDRATAQVGGTAFKRVPWDYDSRTSGPIPGGTIVAVDYTEDGEVEVTTLDFKGRRGNLEPQFHRRAAGDCASIEPSDPARCWRTVRQCMAFLGQRQGLNGPPFTEFEETIRTAAWALLRAARPTSEAT